jgi:DNA damage-binding protein 1
MTGIKRIWSLKHFYSDDYDKYLVQSFLGETRLLSIENDEMSEVLLVHEILR